MFEVWFLYALISSIFLGFTTIVDKLMLEKRLSSFSYFVAFLPPAMVICICLLLSSPSDVFSLPYVIASIAGLASAVGYFFYVPSIRREEASRIAALTSLSPAFVALLAVVLINEILSAQSYLGMILMMLGSVLISYKGSSMRKIIPFSLILILIAANLSFGVEQTLSKMSLDRISSFWPFLMMFMFGRFAVALPGLGIPSVRRKFTSEIRELNRDQVLTLGSGSIMWSLAIVLFFYAVSLGPVTLVATTNLICPLFTLFFAILITRFRPEILREEIDNKTVALKLVAIVLIILGTCLIIT
jgi:transporter family protein